MNKCDFCEKECIGALKTGDDIRNTSKDTWHTFCQEHEEEANKLKHEDKN